MSRSRIEGVGVMSAGGGGGDGTIADGAVTTAKLANGAVTTNKIADGTITNADIAVAAAIALSKLDIDIDTGWAVAAGYTPVRDFDPTSITLGELAAVVGTLVDVLKSSTGILGS